MKAQRQRKILELIVDSDISTQHALSTALKLAGLESTQATISRDIRELGLTKEQSPEGDYRYVAPRPDSMPNYADRLRIIFRESVTSVAVAQNLVILRTLSGLANGACSAIDSMNVPGLVGTLAGDDTCFLAMEDVRAAENFRAELAAML